MMNFRVPALRLPRPLGGLLRLGCSAAVLVLLWQVLDGPAVVDRLYRAEIGWLVAAVVALNLQTIVSAVRWRLTAAQLGQRLGLRWAVAECYLAQFLNQALPGGVMGDVGRAVRARVPAGLRVSSQSVVIERLAGQIALFAVMLAAIAATSLAPGGLRWPEGTSALTLAALAVAAAVLVSALRVRSSPQRLARILAPAAAALASPGVRRRQVALSLSTAACNIAAFAFCARATGTVLQPATAAALVPLILLAMVIPLTVAGWGFREGAAAAVLPLAGATPEAGTAASVAFGAMLLVASLPGLLPLVRPPPAEAPGQRPDSGQRAIVS